MSKFVNLEQIKVLANKVKSEDAALGTKLETVTTKVDNLVAAGGEANILEGVKVNGAALAISDKMVDILIASGEENGTISVNGAAVAIKGLAALAYKSEITEDELGEALKASIAAKATKADLDAMTVRVGDIEKAGYQTAEQVQAAIAASGHAHFEVAETDPTAEGFAAQANVMYLYMNSKTKHYDIYAKVGGGMKLQEPGLDLALVAAVLSSYYDVPLPEKCVLWGEVDLNGQVRPVAAHDLRLAQARRLGFEPVIHPGKGGIATIADLQQKLFHRKQ